MNRVIRLTIETGSLTGIWLDILSMINTYIDAASVALITLILSFVPPRTGYNLCPLCIISGVYSCTLLVVLNSRIKFNVMSLSTTWKDSPSQMNTIPVEHIRPTNSTARDSLYDIEQMSMTYHLPSRGTAFLSMPPQAVAGGK